jgi:hypothetical protein
VLLTVFYIPHCLPYFIGGNDLNLEPIRDVTLLPAATPGMRVGLVDCGLPVCRTTWTHAQFAWEIDPRISARASALPECPQPGVTYESVAKSPAKLLKSNPVDLLVIDHSRHDRAASGRNGSLTPLLHVLWKSGGKEMSRRLWVCQGRRTGRSLHPTGISANIRLFEPRKLEDQLSTHG